MSNQKWYESTTKLVVEHLNKVHRNENNKNLTLLVFYSTATVHSY